MCEKSHLKASVPITQLLQVFQRKLFRYAATVLWAAKKAATARQLRNADTSILRPSRRRRQTLSAVKHFRPWWKTAKRTTSEVWWHNLAYVLFNSPIIVIVDKSHTKRMQIKLVLAQQSTTSYVIARMYKWNRVQHSQRIFSPIWHAGC